MKRRIGDTTRAEPSNEGQRRRKTRDSTYDGASLSGAGKSTGNQGADHDTGQRQHVHRDGRLHERRLGKADHDAVPGSQFAGIADGPDEAETIAKQATEQTAATTAPLGAARAGLLSITAHPYLAVRHADDGRRFANHWEATGVPGIGRIDRAIIRTVSAGTSPMAVTM